MSAPKVTLKVGEGHEIRLPGLSAAGYQWFCDVEGDQKAIEVTKGWGPRAGHPGSVGTSADEIFTVAARSPGQARLRFEQRRRWEEGVPPADSLLVTVEVQG